MMYSVFIISHGRADRVETYDTLRNAGYHGPINIVVDTDDEKEYRERFGRDVIAFDKDMIREKADTIYPYKLNSSALYSRIFVEMCADQIMSTNAYIVLDDDITNFRHRYIENGSIKTAPVVNITKVFDNYIEYMLTANIATLSFIYNMFFVSGVECLNRRVADSRHTYQIHIRNLNCKVDWTALANNDTITELNTMKLGYLWWSLPFIDFDAVPMNTKSGGMKEVYDSVSDYEKNFLAVISCPNCCKVGYSESTRGKIRIVEDKHTSYPMIVSSRYRK